MKKWTRPGAVLLAICTVACDGSSTDDPGADTPGDVAGDVAGDASGDAAQVGCANPSDRQPRNRFPAGRAFWLPADCGDGWLVSGPTEVSVFGGATDGFRFTPTAPGTYQVTHPGGAGFTVTVVDPGDAPFHNYNYYPTRSLAAVGDELWVAGVQSPTVTRLSAADLTTLGTTTVGGWPVALADAPEAGVVVVAQRADDTLGILDSDSGALVDSIWVGDEPANVVVSGTTAWVALATESAVAEVDLVARIVTRRYAVVPDPMAMAISDDGQTLYVAMHRSGHVDRTPFDPYEASLEKDISIVSLGTDAEAESILSVGTTINGLLVDGDRLLVATTVNDTVANLADPEAPSFIHQVAALEPSAGEASVTLSADLTRQPSSGGHAVSLHALAQTSDAIWVVAEGSDAVIALDPETFEELRRIPTSGRPRFVLARGETVFVHGAQTFEVHRVEANMVTHSEIVGTDPRPAPLAGGQAYFTGAGRDYAANWSCNSCHADGLTDTLIWNAGPFSDRIVPRPFTWLEGTWPLGWAGYMTNVRDYALTVNTNVGIRPTTEEFESLWSYLSSIMPPPAANGWTLRDGQHSPEGLEGKALYEGEAGCAGCHALPLTTNRGVLGEGITEGVSDVPILVGAYRYNTWLKFGDATTLESAVGRAADWLGKSLSDPEVASLTRYIQELTGRDFFLLNSEPRAAAATWAIDQPIGLTFSLPVSDEATNRARIVLAGPEGPIDATVTVDGRHVTLTPDAALAHATDYTLTLDASLESYGETTLFEPTTVTFSTARKPAFVLAERYIWTVDMPLANPIAGTFDKSTVVKTPVVLEVTPTASGGAVRVDYGDDLVMETFFVVDGDQLITGPLPIPIGPSFADSPGFVATLADLDGDDVADTASGEVVISGPGFLESGVAWRLAPPLGDGECEVAQGDVLIDFAGDDPVISWGTDNALGVYATSPGATLPLGPGQVVSQGDAYFVLEAEEFPAGFAGPATWGIAPDGAIEATETHGGPAGGADVESGTCVKVSVLTATFKILETIFVWP